MVVRKLLDMMFSQHDLAWLDDILPDKDKKKEDDKKKKKAAAPEAESDEEVREIDLDTHTHTRTHTVFVFSVHLNVSLQLVSACQTVFCFLILNVSPLCPTVLLKGHCSTLTTVFLRLSLSRFKSCCLTRPRVYPVV